jgi:ubiquinone/menaquinone biosynthesis C-methylase UbiE
MNAAAAPNTALERYYQFHSRIYDATRWSFLFGREEILRRAARVTQPRRILEVGCGTGRNLVSLRRRFPQAEITGVDLSEPMLAIAASKVRDERTTLLRRCYSAPVHESGAGFDLVLFSYALSMCAWKATCGRVWRRNSSRCLMSGGPLTAASGSTACSSAGNRLSVANLFREPWLRINILGCL